MFSDYVELQNFCFFGVIKHMGKETPIMNNLYHYLYYTLKICFPHKTLFLSILEFL